MATLSELDHVLDLPVRLEAVLPGPAMRVGELLALAEGCLINTGRQAGETVEVFAAGALLGYAELTSADGHRAVRMVRFHAEGS
jgi:flagellar motor switch/type III secretory pathway protein FliN